MIKSILNSSICVLLLVLLGCSPDKGAFEIALPKDEAIISRGKLLVHGIAACGYCHGKQGRPGDLLVGGLPFEDRYGEVLASNITPARSGLQGWKVNDVISALRSSKSKSGRDLSPDVHQGYEWMSDQDLLAIASYLLNIPGVENEVQIREIGFIEKNTASIFSASAKDVGGFVPAIRQKDQVAFGKYLTDHVARCGSCHSRPGNIFLDEDYLGGGRSVN
ncbi:MAG: hypothetical protein KDD53_11695, partial [Bdellovibrionales bacterium]|nr:hypothetical protein [Bdellovibrionales bacterium]